MKTPRSATELRFSQAQGRTIHDLRIQRKLSRRQVSKQTGLSQQTIYRIEAGESIGSTYEIAILARCLKASISDIIPDPACTVALPPRKESRVAVAKFEMLWDLSKQCRPSAGVLA